jgi:hypothetical protein
MLEEMGDLMPFHLLRHHKNLVPDVLDRFLRNVQAILGSILSEDWTRGLALPTASPRLVSCRCSRAPRLYSVSRTSTTSKRN